MKLDDIRRLANRVFRAREEVSAAYVYGSFVKTKVFNDVDIGLLLREGFDADPLYEVRLAGRFEEAFGGSFDVRVLNGRPLRFLFHILRDAVPIFVRDEGQRIAFESTVLREYLDLRPYHDRFEEQRRVQYGLG
jgi:predicted nucleotidyltransferase